MNKILKLSWMFVAAMLLTTACNEPNEPTPPPQPEQKLELAFSAGQVTSTTISYTITPNIEDATYYAELFPAGELTSERDIAMKAALMTMEEAYTGTQTITAEELTAESEYKVLYFGYDATEKRYTTDYIVSDVIKTGNFEISETIALELVAGSETWRNAFVKVQISDENLEYIFDIMEKSKWEQLYAENPESIVAARIAGWEKDVDDGLEANPTMDTWQKYMAIYQHSRNQTVNASEYYNMYWATDYVMYAFGMNDEGFQTTKVATVEFKTATPTPSSNTFTIEIGELTASTVAFNVTAANNDPYFLTIQDKRYVERFLGANATETWEDMIWDLTFVKTDEQIQDYIFAGSQSLTNADINKNVDTLHEYQVVIWGFNEGPTTEIFVSDVFQPYEEVVELKLFLDIEGTTSDTLTATVTASTDEAAYYVGCITAEQFGADYGLSYISNLYGNLTEEDLNFGTQTLTFEGLTPETEYYVIAFGYDAETGEATTDLVYKNERTMPVATLGEVFTVAVNDIEWRNAQISVATEYTGTYIYGILTAAKFAEYADAAAIFEARKAGWENTASYYEDTTWQEMMVYDLVSGNKNFDASEEITSLTWGESYVFYSLGVTAEGDIDTALTVAEFSTLSPEGSDCTFEITIDAMTKSSVNFTITPSNPDEQYYVTVQKSSVVDGKTSEEILRNLLGSVSDYQISTRTFTGEQSLTNSNVSATVNGFSQYRVIVWGFNNGPTTEVFMSEAFKPADPE